MSCRFDGRTLQKGSPRLVTISQQPAGPLRPAFTIRAVVPFDSVAPVMAGRRLSGAAATVITEPGGARSPWAVAASACEQHGDEYVGQPALVVVWAAARLIDVEDVEFGDGQRP